MMRTANASARLWVGPLMLVIIIALIYLLSLMPATPPMPNNGLIMPDSHPEYTIKGQSHVDWNEVRFRHDSNHQLGDQLTDNCGPNGSSNGTECKCRAGYSGEKCEIMNCMNGGNYNHTLGKCECDPPFYGRVCSLECNQGTINPETGVCECALGRMCNSLRCLHGKLDNGHCKCSPGWSGPACTQCDITVCDDMGRRRGAVNSRLTLSGLSFCIITIGLLCVGARRRRSQMTPMSDETWYRVFHPNNNRPFRCRHDYMCGGSWVPRDRALIVAPGRVSMSSTTPRIHRLATPPPSYTSVDESGDSQTLPPTYEEATRIEIVDEEPEIVEEAVEEQKDTTSSSGEDEEEEVAEA